MMPVAHCFCDGQAMIADVGAIIATSNIVATGELTSTHPIIAGQDSIQTHISSKNYFKSHSDTYFIKHHTNI
jgi:hypothetical protein